MSRLQIGQGTQQGAWCSTAIGARWHGQSHASPGGGVGTNFMKFRSLFGNPRMPQLTPETLRAEAAG